MTAPLNEACYELAEHFLDEEHHEDDCIDALARAVHETVKGFLSVHECKPSKMAVCPWCAKPCERELVRKADGLTLREECGCCEGCEDARQEALKEDGEMERADMRLSDG